ncbi:MAG TPA: TolC family protein [Longimicrobiaceae bacterium]
MQVLNRTISVAPVAALLLIACAAGVRAQEPMRVVTLEEAIEQALGTDPAAVAASGAEVASRAQLRQAWASYFPTLTLNSSYGNSSNQRFDQATGRLVSESYTAQITAGYDIFTGGRRVLQQRAARAEVVASSAEHRAQRFQTILNTERTFYAAAAGDELVMAAEQRLARARQQLSFAQVRLEVGTATRSDLLRAELEVGNAELAVLDAESARRSARLQLGRQMGRDEEVQPAPGALPDQAPDLPSVEALAERAERTAPTAVAARSTFEARRAASLSSMAAYLPTLRATGGYDWQAIEFPPDDRSWSLRLIASVPVFNGLQRETAVTQARVNARIASARARDAAIGARIAAEDAARELASAERRVEIAGRAVELAREDLRVQEERYQLGNVTILDLQASQLALAEAEVAWVEARQALATSIGQLEAVLGQTISEMTRELPAGSLPE